MKNVVTLLFISLCSCQPHPKATPINYVVEDLKACEFLYENLTIKGGVQSEKKIYYHQKRKFTGCAKQPIQGMETNVGYFVYEITDGKIEREICVYSSGQLERDFHFKKGIPDGKHMMWYEDGSQYIDHTFEKGKPIKMLRWYRNGQLAQEDFFENGEKVKEVKYKMDGTMEN